MKWIMAKDQYGQFEHGLDAKHPRADLMKRLGVKSCRKQYSEFKTEGDKHTGYIIGGRWFTFYTVEDWKR